MSQVFRVRKGGVVEGPIEAAYRIAADVASYPEFLSGVKWVKVRAHTVEMAVQVGPLSLVWEQKVDYQPFTAITFRQVRGPFRWLRGGWQFRSKGNQTEVSYYTEFELDLPLPGLGHVISHALEANLRRAIIAFGQRLQRAMAEEAA